MDILEYYSLESVFFGYNVYLAEVILQVLLINLLRPIFFLTFFDSLWISQRILCGFHASQSRLSPCPLASALCPATSPKENQILKKKKTKIKIKNKEEEDSGREAAVWHRESQLTL